MEFLYALISKLKENYIFILLVFLLIVINDAIILGDFYALKTHEVKLKSSSEDITKESIINESIFVDIKGEVKNPGVYSVNNSMNVNDVIKLAGGLKKNASTYDINLSKKVSDQMVIVISSKNKINKKVDNNEIVINNDAKITNEETAVISTDISNNKELPGHTLVNINTASLEQLLTVSGIGQSKADAIIKYREINKFNSIEDIKNVSGIGESLFEKIKDYITI